VVARFSLKTRRLEPEWLDELPPADPRAAASRRDLGRLNAVMRNARTVARVLRAAFGARAPSRLAEAGAGDGRFFLSVAQCLAGVWPGSSVTLVDRQKIVAPGAGEELRALGWTVEIVQADVNDWLDSTTAPAWDAVVANLFLHHFADADLARLLRRLASRTQVFIAIEPRRSAWTLAWSRGVGLLGCNPVTRHDAPASVRAGFAGHELTRLWPADATWSLEERSAGWFGHLFIARRKSLPQ
jgi:hypothetical protein